MIIKRCQDHTLQNEDGELDKSISFSTGISLMTPIKPMLAKKVESYEDIFIKSPKGVFSEIKYDGERIQIHIDGDQFKCFSRNLKALADWKVCFFFIYYFYLFFSLFICVYFYYFLFILNYFIFYFPFFIYF